MQYLNLKGINLAYLEKGEGIPILFLHNGGSFHGIWKHQIQFFKEKYKIYAIDLLNFGETDYIKDKGSIDDHYEIVASFLKEKNIKNPIIIGCCIGASLALYCSKKISIRGLVLFNICPGIDLMRNPLAKFFFQTGKTNKTFNRLNLTLIKSVMNSGIENIRLPQLLYGRVENPEDETYQTLKKLYRTEKQKNARIELFNSIDTFTVKNFIDKNDKLPPSIIFWGEFNKIVPLEVGYELEKIIKPKEFISMKDLGHLMMLEKPRPINSIIDKFLTTLVED